MKIKTSDLEGAALDLAVSQVDDRQVYDLDWRLVDGDMLGFGTIGSSPEFVCFRLSGGTGMLSATPVYSPSTDWSQGGPLIEQHEITVDPSRSGPWSAANGSGNWVEGDTPLISACRAIVAAKLGDEVEVPDELL